MKTKRTDLDLVAIGQRMKLVRARLRKTQASMAHDLGVSLSHYSKLEVGIGGMSHGLIYTFCRLFNIDQDWFCYGQGGEPNPIDPAEDGANTTTTRLPGINVSEELLIRIIEQAIAPNTSVLAEQFSKAAQIPKARAIALLIKEKLQSEAIEKANEKKAAMAAAAAANEAKKD